MRVKVEKLQKLIRVKVTYSINVNERKIEN